MEAPLSVTRPLIEKGNIQQTRPMALRRAVVTFKGRQSDALELDVDPAARTSLVSRSGQEQVGDGAQPR